MDSEDIYLFKRTLSESDKTCESTENDSLHDLLIRSTSEREVLKLDICRTLSLELSPRNIEAESVEEVDYSDILERVDCLPIYYYEVEDRRYIGPLKEDWNENCRINPTRKILIGTEIEGKLVREETLIKNETMDDNIESVDVMGVCLASIKGLSIEINNMKERISALEERLL